MLNQVASGDIAKAKELLSKVENLADEECAICLETMENGVVTMCGHLFCKSCIEKHLALETSGSACPICRKVISAEQLVPLPKASENEKEKTEVKWRSSSKIEALLKSLQAIADSDPEIKSIVFSQWTSMLDLVEIALKNNNIRFVRLDGSMNYQQREKSINAFREDPSIKVFLISMKAGGTGLNLTTASNVYLLDPWWNPATEEQAIDRVHRIGQTRPVTVTRFCIFYYIETLKMYWIICCCLQN
jgi:SNF2 family DNA or RNA helicase